MKYNKTILPSEYFSKKGISFKGLQDRKELAIACPFKTHERDDKNPACHVESTTGVFHCKKCEAHGSFKDLMREFGDELESSTRVSKNKKQVNAKKITEAKIEEYHQALPDEILEYLHDRGIADELIERYKIGWGTIYGEQRITIPIRDSNGKALFVKARKNPLVKEEDDERNKLVVYPSGNETIIFPADEIVTYKDELVICEGEFDCIILRSHGIPAITSTGGAGTFKEIWITEYLQQFKKVYICLDKDPAGNKATPKLIEKIENNIPRAKIYRVDFPERMTDGKDVTDYFTKYNGTHEEFLYELPRWVGGQKPIDTSQFKELESKDLMDVLGLTIKRDDENKLVTFLALLSAYTEDSQFNISFNAPSSTGKSYIPMEIAKLFPQEDVRELGYCSPTAFFHEVGVRDKKRNGYVVDFSRKIIIFLDQPHNQLLERLRPMLSHDKKEIEFKITDKSQKHGLRAKNVFLRGYPSVIFCSAGMMIDEQESTRFLLLSPEINQKKIREAVDERVKKDSDKAAYVSWIEEDPRRKLLKLRIEAIRNEEIQDIIIPNPKTVADTFLKSKKLLRARHTRDVGRLISLIKVFALLNVWFREREADAIVANNNDIEKAFRVWEKISESQEYNLPPFVYKVYKEAILLAWNEKNKEIKSKEQRGLTRHEVRKKYYEANHELLDDWRLRQQILPALEVASLIEQRIDLDNKKVKLIYVTIQ